MFKWLANILVKGWVEATSFRTTGGTYSDFVKGDGSLDNSDYITDVSWEEVSDKRERFKPRQHTHQLSQSALGAWICMTTEADDLRIGIVESNTRLYINGEFQESYNEPTNTTLTLDAGDILSTNNKPIGVASERQGRMASLNLSGSVFGFFSNRDSPHSIFIYAPFGNGEVEYYYDGHPDVDAPTSTVEFKQGEITVLETPSASEGHHRIYSNTPIVVTKHPSNNSSNDAMQVPPMSDEIILKSTHSGLGKNLTTTNYSANNGYAWSNDGLIYSQSIADGAGSNMESALPIDALGNIYIVPHIIRDYGLAAIESGTINVYYWDEVAKGWVLYKSHESDGSKTNIFTHQEGDASGNVTNPDLFPSSPVLFSGNINFYLRTNSRNAREYAVLGYRSSDRVFSAHHYLTELHWDELNDKPTEFPVEAHSHPQLDIDFNHTTTPNGGISDSTLWDNGVSLLNVSGGDPTYPHGYGTVATFKQSGARMFQLFHEHRQNELWARHLYNQEVTEWVRYWNSGNLDVSNLVHKSGIETITGRKDFNASSQVQIILQSTSGGGSLLDINAPNTSSHAKIRFQYDDNGSIVNLFNVGIEDTNTGSRVFSISKAFNTGDGINYLEIDYDTEEVTISGDLTAKSLATTDGESHQSLMADGSVNESGLDNYYLPLKQHVGRIGGQTDLGWKRLFHIKFDATETGYGASKISGYIYDENGNYHQNRTRRYQFQWIVQGGSGSSTSDSSSLYLQSTMPDILRVVKNNVNDYELQIRTYNNYRHIGYDIREWGNSNRSLEYAILDDTENDPGTGTVDENVYEYSDLVDWEEITSKPSFINKITEWVVSPNDATVTNDNNSTSGITWASVSNPTEGNYPTGFGIVWSFRDSYSRTNRSFDIFKDTNSNRFFLRGYNGTYNSGSPNQFREIAFAHNLDNYVKRAGDDVSGTLTFDNVGSQAIRIMESGTDSVINFTGFIFGRAEGNYLRPSSNGDKDLHIGGATSGSFNWNDIKIIGDGVFTYNGNSIFHEGNLTIETPIAKIYADRSALGLENSIQEKGYFYQVTDASDFPEVYKGKAIVALTTDPSGSFADYSVIWSEYKGYNFLKTDAISIGINNKNNYTYLFYRNSNQSFEIGVNSSADFKEGEEIIGFKSNSGELTIETDPSVTLSWRSGYENKIPVGGMFRVVFTEDNIGLLLGDLIKIQGQNLTGTEIDLSNIGGNNYNYSSFSSSETYTTVNPVINGFARCFISATNEPTVTGATKVYGADFISNTDMEMVVESPNGSAVEYYFLER